MVRLIASLAVSLLISACATHSAYTDTVSSWVGKPVDDLVIAWGPPSSERDLKGGGKVMEWVRGMGSTSTTLYGVTTTTDHTCRTTFIVDGEGRVKTWRWEGSGCVS